MTAVEHVLEICSHSRDALVASTIRLLGFVERGLLRDGPQSGVRERVPEWGLSAIVASLMIQLALLSLEKCTTTVLL